MYKLGFIVIVDESIEKIGRTYSSIRKRFLDEKIYFINDFSSEDSIKVLEDIKADDKNIIIHTNEKKQGLGMCKNIGIDICSDDYFWILEAGDEIIVESRERLTNILNNKVDFLTFTSYVEDNFYDKMKRKVTLKSFEDAYYYELSEAMIYAIDNRCSTKIWSTKYFKKANFKFSNKGFEDIWVKYYVSKGRHFHYSGKPLYKPYRMSARPKTTKEIEVSQEAVIYVIRQLKKEGNLDHLINAISVWAGLIVLNNVKQLLFDVHDRVKAHELVGEFYREINNYAFYDSPFFKKNVGAISKVELKTMVKNFSGLVSLLKIKNKTKNQ